MHFIHTIGISAIIHNTHQMHANLFLFHHSTGFLETFPSESLNASKAILLIFIIYFTSPISFFAFLTNKNFFWRPKAAVHTHWIIRSIFCNYPFSTNAAFSHIFASICRHIFCLFKQFSMVFH